MRIRPTMAAIVQGLRAVGTEDRAAGEWERFVRYASQMLEEREFFIRKAIGWVLREAVKHLSSQDRDRLLDAYRNR